MSTNLRTPAPETSLSSLDEKARQRAMMAILLVVFIDILGFTVVIPLLPFYTEHFGGTPFVVGSVTAVYGLCQFIAGPMLGILSDRIGRKPVLIISQFGTLIGFVVLATAASLPFVFLGRIIDGLTAGNISVAQAFIADLAGPKNRTKAFGMFGAVFGLGFIAGPALSGFLAHYSLTAPLWASAGLSVVTLITNMILLPKTVPGTATLDAASTASAPATPTEAGAPTVPMEAGAPTTLATSPAHSSVTTNSPATPRRKRPSKWQMIKKLNVSLLPFFFFTLAFTSFTSGLALYAERGLVWNGKPFGTTQVGWVLTIGGLVSFSVQAGLIGRVAKWASERSMSMFGFASMAVGYALLAPGQSPFVFAGLFLLGSIGQSFIRPTLTSLTSQLADRHEQGLALGSSQSLQSISQATAPLLSGLMIEKALLHEWTLLCAGFAFIGMLLTLRIPKRIHHHNIASTPASLPVETGERL